MGPGALGADLLAAAALDAVVYPQQHRPGWDKRFHQQLQQQTRRQPAVPDSAVQHPVPGDEVPLLAQPDDAQDAAHRALARHQQRTQQQHLCMLPGPRLHKHRRECYKDRGEAGRYVQHGGFSWKRPARLRLSAPPPNQRAAITADKWTKSN
jgi:hypothetical protein